MSSQPSDLGVLSRGAGGSVVTAPAAVPRPPSRWKTRVLLPWGVIAAAAALLAYAARDALLPRTPVKVVPVVLRAASSSTSGPASFTVQAPGWVEPDPYPIAAAALTDGVIEDVLVLEGQAVKKGDVVARMIGDDARIGLAAAEAAVREREGELKLAQATREAAVREWESPTERTRAVASNAALLAEARASLQRLASEIAAEQARVDELADIAARTEKSAASNAASASELAVARLKLNAQRAVLEATRANRPVLEAKVQQHEAECAAAIEHAKLRIPERRALAESEAAVARAAAALESAKAAREAAKLRLVRMEIRAPADGVVMSRHVEPGSTMMLTSDRPAAAHAVRLYDPKRLQVRVDVPLADAAKVSVGQRAKVVVGVLPDRTFDGEVTRVVPEADIARNTLQVKVRITDPDAALRPEMLARVRFADTAAGSAPSAAASSQHVFAPLSLLQMQPDGKAKVWVVDRGRGVAETRTVTPGGARFEGWVVVRDGLQPGDQLIAGDTAGLQSGDRVKVIGEGEAPPAAQSGGKGDSHAAH